MRFIEHSGLSRLSALLHDLDVGDRLLSGRLELFSTADNKDVKPSEDENQKCHENLKMKIEKMKSSQSEVSPSPPSILPPVVINSIELPTSKLEAEAAASSTLVVSVRKRTRTFSEISDASVKRWKLSGKPTTATESRKLLVQLVNTMNACFPDYDFRYPYLSDLIHFI